MLSKILMPRALQRRIESINTIMDRAEKIREVLVLLGGKCGRVGEEVYEEDFKTAWSKVSRLTGYQYIQFFMAVDFQDKYATFDSKMDGGDRLYSGLTEMQEAYLTHVFEMGLPVQFLAKDGTVLLIL